MTDWPPYLANLALELWKKPDGEHYIKVGCWAGIGGEEDGERGLPLAAALRCSPVLPRPLPPPPPNAPTLCTGAVQQGGAAPDGAVWRFGMRAAAVQVRLCAGAGLLGPKG